MVTAQKQQLRKRFVLNNRFLFIGWQDSCRKLSIQCSRGGEKSMKSPNIRHYSQRCLLFQCTLQCRTTSTLQWPPFRSWGHPERKQKCDLDLLLQDLATHVLHDKISLHTINQTNWWIHLLFLTCFKLYWRNRLTLKQHWDYYFTVNNMPHTGP